MKRGLIAFVFIFWVMPVIAADLAYETLDIKDGFKPGFGEPVGHLVTVTGKVAIVHSNKPVGYAAEPWLPLYKEDAVVTGKPGRVTFKLKDGSVMSLSQNTKLIINESIYAPDVGYRSSFLSMAFGKARFWVKKLTGFKRKEFKVKMKTAILGVRGSDFIIDLEETRVNISTMEDTDLQLTLVRICETSSDCESKQYTLTDYQHAYFEIAEPEIGKETPEPEIRNLSPEEIKKFENEFPPVPPDGETADMGGVYYARDSYENPAASENSESAPIVNADVEDGASMIEDEIVENFDFSTDPLPLYPYEPE